MVEQGVKLQESDIDELHYITHMSNVPSILTNGILSHNAMKKRRITHISVADEDVQSRRSDKAIPGGRKLHDYVNLYLNARNPMLYVLLSQHSELCVLKIDRTILRQGGVIVSDQNAARGWTRFEPAPEGLSMINKDDLFRLSWDSSDPYEKYRLKGIMCAEVLVPEKVQSRFIKGACVSCEEAAAKLIELSPGFPVSVNRHLFFQ